MGEPSTGLPSESVGTPPPPRDVRKGLRIALAVAVVVGLACLLTWNAARAFVSVAYVLLMIVFSVRALVRGIRRRRRRSRSLSGRGGQGGRGMSGAV
jgi:membrane protein implicated in regulation of membrane protease activity